MSEYKFNEAYYKIHSDFNNECSLKTIDLNSFKSKGNMLSIVQNCPYSDGVEHKQYILNNYPFILTQDNIERWKRYDSVGGNGNKGLIDGLTPKVFSYIKEILIFYTIYLKDKNITELESLMVIGGGYGLEIVLLYDILTLFNINIKNIYGIDMTNVAELQNYLFKTLKLDHICKSFDSSFRIDNIDCIYSNCCLAEVPPEINYEYYNNYFLKSKYAYLVWTHLFSEVPKYYKDYCTSILENWNLAKDVNTLIIK
jgi:hypothetical protein